MESKELVNFRIGNYILDTNKNKVIKMDFGTLEAIHYSRNQMYSPIKVTVEHLINFGFVKRADFESYTNMWELKGFMISLEYYINIHVDLADEIKHDYHLIRCYEELFVHELQNIYFTLVGKELELKQEFHPATLDILEKYGKEIEKYANDYFTFQIVETLIEGEHKDASLYIIAREIEYEYNIINVSVIDITTLKITLFSLTDRPPYIEKISILHGLSSLDAKIGEMLSSSIANQSLKLLANKINLKRKTKR